MQHSGGAWTEGPDHGERISRLLAGEPIDRCGIDYDLDSHHLGLIVTGGGAERLLRQLAEALDRDLLIHGEPEATAWLGGPRAFEPAEFDEISAVAVRHAHLVAIGETGDGLAGWRATNRQAQTAYRFAVRCPRPFSRYGDVALIATVAESDDLRSLLEERFLAPLAADPRRDLVRTLRAYLDSGGEVASAAAALCVDRNTVVDRIAAIEKLLGRPPRECLTELDLAQRLRGLSDARGTDLSGEARLNA